MESKKSKINEQFKQKPIDKFKRFRELCEKGKGLRGTNWQLQNKA